MTRRHPQMQSQAASTSFVDTLGRVLSMARKAEHNDEFRAELRQELQALPSKAKIRLAALLNRGREAHDSVHVHARVPLKDTVTPLDVMALCNAHTLSQRLLERGLAAACAEQLTLDEMATHRVGSDNRLSVFERAWSRFGRELAGSEPGEWSWFACYKGRSRMLDKLYVRRGNNAWWSFATALDRPPREQIDVDRRRAKNARSSGSSLESLLNQEGSPTRRALRRALTSVHARLGKVQGEDQRAAQS